MVIGTTPTYSITLNNFNISRARTVIFVFTQGEDDVRIHKTGSEVHISKAGVISTRLEQHETLRFRPNKLMNFGLIVVDKNGNRFETPIFTETVEPGLYGGIVAMGNSAPHIFPDKLTPT